MSKKENAGLGAPKSASAFQWSQGEDRPRHIVESDTPEGHVIRVHSDGSRELVCIAEDGSMFVVRAA